jgi:hypothetical protein
MLHFDCCDKRGMDENKNQAAKAPEPFWIYTIASIYWHTEKKHFKS